MSISLDGITSETNNLTRGNGSFEKTFNTIKTIKKWRSLYGKKHGVKIYTIWHKK